MLRRAVGVNGQAVLAHSTNGVVITRSGGHILNVAFSPSDPVFLLILKSATELHKTIGDGVKTYVMFLNNLLNFLTFKNVHQLLFKMQVFETKLQDCFLRLTCDCGLNDNILCNVIETFFCTRFTSVVSGTLSKLVFEWICKLPSVLDISIYLYNFQILCLKLSPFPLLVSTVQDGILLKGIHSRRLPQNVNHCLLKVYYHPLNTTPDVNEIDIDVLEIIEETKPKGFNTLLVTNIFIQERVLFLLNSKNIFVIHSVCYDVVKFLHDKSLVSTELIVEYRYINELLWISMEGVHQLLIKAPSTTLATEYSDSILDCLKMLHYSFKQSSCIVPVGGAFEQALAKQLFVVNKTLGPKLPPLVNREQALNWKEADLEPNLLKHINTTILREIDFEVTEMFCNALLSSTTAQSNSENVEPLVLKLSIYLKAVNTLTCLLKLNGAVVKQKKGRLV